MATRTMPASTIDYFSTDGMWVNDSSGARGAYVAALGYYFIPEIENSSQFRSLSRGEQYHAILFSSFGYEKDGTSNDSVIVTLFSPDNLTEITTFVNVQSGNITTMYLYENYPCCGFHPYPAPARSGAPPLPPWAVPLITGAAGAAVIATMTFSMGRARSRDPTMNQAVAVSDRRPESSGPPT